MCDKRCKGSKQDDIQAKLSAIETSLTPLPYTFRVSAPNRKSQCPNQQTQAPPFYLQLDHALAVLWCLFRKQAQTCPREECELGIGQLQWALYFLKGIKTPSGGDRSEDVSLAIQTVQDALIDLYADMASIVMQSCTSNAPTNSSSCTTCESIRRNFTSSFPRTPKSSVPSCHKCHSMMFGDQDKTKDNFGVNSKKTSFNSPSSKITISSKNAVCQTQVCDSRSQKSMRDSKIICEQIKNVNKVPSKNAVSQLKACKLQSQKSSRESKISEDIKDLKKLATEFAKRSTAGTKVSDNINKMEQINEEQPNV